MRDSKRPGPPARRAAGCHCGNSFPSPPLGQPQRNLLVLTLGTKGIRACAKGEIAAGVPGHTLFQCKEKERARVAPLSLSHLGPCLWLHWVSPSLAGPQMLCLSQCPGKGEVSPFQPSSPLGLLAASSGGPPLWWLEMVQSGAVGVLVAHEQMPRQPLVPCSREALEPQSQQRKCGLQAA